MCGYIVYCLFVYNFVCVCTLQISPAGIKLSASNFARCFMGVLGRESPILGNFAFLKAQNRANRPPTRSKVQGGKTYRNRVHITFARRVDVGSACVDIRPLYTRASNVCPVHDACKLMENITKLPSSALYGLSIILQQDSCCRHHKHGYEMKPGEPDFSHISPRGSYA